ncbi:MAG: hypothetical protein V9G24_11145 [Rhodoblastus sp.]|jgi:hypothetical protein
MARVGDEEMAEILIFRARPRSEHEVGARYAEPAKILFFTGVRYMRMDEDDAPQIAVGKSPRRAGKPTTPRRPPRKRA